MTALNKNRFSFALLTATVASLSGCQLTPKSDADTNWYMRSEITWWEARPEYRLISNKDKTLLITDFELRPDGQKYHFKITDKKLSQNRNCGAPERVKRELLIDSWMPLNCQYSGDTLMPLGQGYYYVPKQQENLRLEVKLVEGWPVEMRIRAG